MNYAETMDYLKKVSVTGSILGMESVIRLCNELGNPENKQKVIHIAGTNGKGSVGMFIEETLTRLGYNVGRFSSPKVFEYEEMFKLNNKNVSKERLAKVMTEVRSACEKIVEKGFPHPTVFEVETAAAYLLFFEEKCDYSIIEVGMGGRSDATNVVLKPLLSIITSISKDHVQFLGNTLQDIAYMKAGIIKDGCDVLALKQTDEVNHVISEEAKKCDSKLYWADSNDVKLHNMTYNSMEIEIDNIIMNLKLVGLCQMENVIIAYRALEILGAFSKNQSLSVKALEETRWPGRFETINEKPLVIIDGCHNADAAKKLAFTISNTLKNRTIHFVIGVFKDKDYEEIFKSVLPLGKSAICISPNNERALDKDTLMKVAKKYLNDVETDESIESAVRKAYGQCISDSDVIVVFGSLSYLAEIKKACGEIEHE